MASGNAHDDQGIAVFGERMAGEWFYSALDNELSLEAEKERAIYRMDIKAWCDIPIKESGV